MSIYKPGRPFKYHPASGKGSKPPQQAGLYRICSPQGQMLYIGETCNLARRIREHIRAGKISMDPKAPAFVEYQVADVRSTSRSRRLHERKKIAQHHPVLNKSRGGEGRCVGRRFAKPAVKRSNARL